MPASSTPRPKAKNALPNHTARRTNDAEPAPKEEDLQTGPDTSTEYYCSGDKLNRIHAWLDDVACLDSGEDVATVQTLPPELYKDWLDWTAEDAAAWLRKLDIYEQRFRTAGFSYHQVPYQVRHSSAMLHGSRIEQSVLVRLSQILETDRPRSKQMFFAPWLEIQNAAAHILKYSKHNFPFADDLNHLRDMHHQFEISLLKLYKSANILETGITWVEGAVAKVIQRSDLYGVETLASRFSCEGGLLRGWVQTFPESDSCFANARLQFIEWYVERLLEVGVEHDQYWTAMVVPALTRDETATL